MTALQLGSEAYMGRDGMWCTGGAVDRDAVWFDQVSYALLGTGAALAWSTTV